MNYTSIEQSKKLVELGLNEGTADMNYRYCVCKLIDGEPKEDWLLGVGKPFDECPEEQIPCWSVGALIELMPEMTMLVRVATAKHASYFVDFGPDRHFTQYYNTAIEAAYDMVCWLLENNYIKKE